jgi:hypothetical protein
MNFHIFNKNTDVKYTGKNLSIKKEDKFGIRFTNNSNKLLLLKVFINKKNILKDVNKSNSFFLVKEGDTIEIKSWPTFSKEIKDFVFGINGNISVSIFESTTFIPFDKNTSDKIDILSDFVFPHFIKTETINYTSFANKVLKFIGSLNVETSICEMVFSKETVEEIKNVAINGKNPVIKKKKTDCIRRILNDGKAIIDRWNDTTSLFIVHNCFSDDIFKIMNDNSCFELDENFNIYVWNTRIIFSEFLDRGEVLSIGSNGIKSINYGLNIDSKSVGLVKIL